MLATDPAPVSRSDPVLGFVFLKLGEQIVIC